MKRRSKTERFLAGNRTLETTLLLPDSSLCTRTGALSVTGSTETYTQGAESRSNLELRRAYRRSYSVEQEFLNVTFPSTHTHTHTGDAE